MRAAQPLRRACLPLQQQIQRACSPRLQRSVSSNPLPVRNSPLLQLPSRHSRRTSIRTLFQTRLSSSKPPINQNPNLKSPEASLSLSQRLRKLSREYGWSALGVYLLLTALDFPFCFLAVRWLGTDRIGHWEHVIIERFWSIIPASIYIREGTQAVEVEGVRKAEEFSAIDRKANEFAAPAYDHGVKEAEQMNQGENASM